MSTPFTSRFLCVHVPSFPAQARLRHRPALRSKAIAILDGTPPLQTVCSTTRAAQQLGVTRGTTRAELDSFPGVQALLRSEQEERAAATAMLTELWNISPRVQVLPTRAGAHRLVVDIAGTERIFGPPQKLARDLQQKLRALGLLAQLAVSDNFHAAVCTSPYTGSRPCIIERDHERQAVAPLPLEALECLTEQQREIFALWGLHTLGDIAALPVMQLIARLGEPGKRLWLLSCGEHPHLMEPEQEQFTLEERMEFDAPVEVLDSLLFVLGPMLDQLVLRAMGRALALASITVRLRLTNQAAEDSDVAGEAATYERVVKPALPLSESRILLKLIHLELQAHPPGAPVLAMHLQAEPGDRARAQLGLFSPQLPEPSRLDVTLARIRALVGEGRVGRPQLHDSHQPDSFSVEPFDVANANDTQSQTTHYSAPASLAAHVLTTQKGQALRRLRPPVPLRMRVLHAKPSRFSWRGVHYEVHAAYGPWLHSGNWWSADAWSCEEWDLTAATAEGATMVCRVARNLLQGCWHLEGLYD